MIQVLVWYFFAVGVLLHIAAPVVIFKMRKAK